MNLAVAVTYNGSASAPTNVGNYTVIGTVTDTNYIGSATNTLIVTKGPAIVTLGTDKRPGTFHVTNGGATTWCRFVRATLEAAGADPLRVEAITTAELDPPRPAPRPANSVLDNMALRLSGLPALPDWHDGLVRLVNALAPDRMPA